MHLILPTDVVQFTNNALQAGVGLEAIQRNDGKNEFSVIRVTPSISRSSLVNAELAVRHPYGLRTWTCGSHLVTIVPSMLL